MSAHDDDDAITRQRTLVAKSEEMAREHSARREIRMREDRVRHIGSEPAEGGALPKKPRPVEPRPVEQRPADAQPASTDAAADDDADKKPRLSDPFPPLSDRKPKPKDAPKRAPARVASAAVETRTKSAHTTSPTGSAVDELALEIEDLLRRARIAWSVMESADRITIVAAIGTLVGVFLPWLSTPARPFALGLTEGGVVHGALALFALALVRGRASDTFVGGGRSLEKAARRTSLYHVLLGALSTVAGVALLLSWGALKSPTHPVDVHFGFYWTLAMGTGLSYGGFARFGSRRGH